MGSSFDKVRAVAPVVIRSTRIGIGNVYNQGVKFMRLKERPRGSYTPKRNASITINAVNALINHAIKIMKVVSPSTRPANCLRPWPKA